MELEVVRQMYELALRRDENSLSKKDRAILKMINIPDTSTVKRLFQVTLKKEEARNSLQSYLDYKDYRWKKAALLFLDAYYDQMEKGMTQETESIICNWAIDQGIPIKIIRLIVRHGGAWSTKKKLTRNRRVSLM